MSDKPITDWPELSDNEVRNLALYGKAKSVRERAARELRRRRIARELRRRWTTAEQAAQKTEANHAG